ncbi:hypothetical protein [Burkholderia multivorans]|nr:hypothetical protein [Burkholderia multivorans]MDR8992511.1 hypothetical protein [Burkholderia multivorans]
MDVVESWLSEFTRDDPDGEIHFGDAYKFFKAWSEAEYNFSYSRKRLGMILQDKGYKPAAKPHRIYKGLQLLVDLQFNENTGAYVGHEFNGFQLELQALGWQNKMLAGMTGEDVGDDDEIVPA